MSIARRVTSLAAMAAVSLSLVLGLDSAAGGAPDVDERAAWGVVPSPNRAEDQNALKGLTALSSNDIWAVGEFNPGVVPTATGRRTLVEHYDGSRWRIVASPNPRWSGLDLATLEDVDAVAPNDVWAVGYSEDFATLRLNTLVEHWDGTRWTIVPSPNPAGTNLPNQLFGVEAIAADDVWAVGEAGTNAKGLILHWDGTRWAVVPNPCGQLASLRGITAVSPDDIWAVGDATTCHFDGSAWTLVPSPQPRLEFDEIGYPLEAVSAVSSTDVWAVGSRVIDTVFQVVYNGFAEHWDGTRWTAFYDVPGVILSDVEALSATEVWAVGTFSLGTLVARWDGQTWNEVPSPDPGDGGYVNALDDLGSDRLWAAGSFFGPQREQTLILQAPSETQGTVVGDTGASQATVSWFGPVDGTDETDIFGEYEAAGLPAGEYLFTASLAGCDPASATVDVVAGTTITQNLRPNC